MTSSNEEKRKHDDCKERWVRKDFIESNSRHSSFKKEI